MKNRIFFGFLVISCFSTISCILTNSDNTNIPYVISKPVCYIKENEGYYNFAGIEFDYYNSTDKIVTRIDVSFMVFDAETKQNPFIGSNVKKMNFTESPIAGKEKRALIIPLDPYIYVAPSTPYIIDFFYVARIEFSDGSTWEDTFGIYFTRSY